MKPAVGATLAGLLLVLLVGAIAAAIWLAPKRPDRLVLRPVDFADLSGWTTDDHAAALAAFGRSCTIFARYADDRRIGPDGLAGTAADWRPVCAALPTGADAAVARRFFETWFTPLAVSNSGRREGLFTGYYEPELRGNATPSSRYGVALYKQPTDLVTVDLGVFREKWKGERIAGRIDRGRFVPYATRREIDAGALAGKNLELLWVDDAIAAFFLHVQGSGKVMYEDGRQQRVGFAGQNGHAYVAIGRELIARGALTRDDLSMQSIRAWLLAHPEQAAEVMGLNPSYVFFRLLEGEAPVGALNAPLTPERSLAIDPRQMPLGAPVWLDVALPADAGVAGAGEAYRRLLIAQDTGGAIRGPVRGDVFFGAGARAEALAGHMKSRGRYWVLLPKTIAAAAVVRAER